MITEKKARPDGTRFLVFLWLSLAIAAVFYLLAHFIYFPTADTAPIPKDLIVLDSFGRVRSMSDIDLRWYVGRDAATAIETTLQSTSDKIDHAVEGEVRQAMLEFEVKFGVLPGGSYDTNGSSDAFEPVRANFEKGDFADAARTMRAFVMGWSADTQKQVGEEQIYNLMYQLEELDSLKQSQLFNQGKVRVSGTESIFWMNPIGGLAEAVSWSILGTLVNLIVNVAYYRARGTFRPSEVWISISKLIYGPVLSLVLILWIYFGIIDASIQVRFWLLPLLGFLFGYNARKTARLVDRLSEKVFDTLGASVKNFGSSLLGDSVKMAAANVAATAKPSSITNMTKMAPAVTEALLTSALTAKSTSP